MPGEGGDGQRLLQRQGERALPAPAGAPALGRARGQRAVGADRLAAGQGKPGAAQPDRARACRDLRLQRREGDGDPGRRAQLAAALRGEHEPQVAGRAIAVERELSHRLERRDRLDLRQRREAGQRGELVRAQRGQVEAQRRRRAGDPRAEAHRHARHAGREQRPPFGGEAGTLAAQLDRDARERPVQAERGIGHRDLAVQDGHAAQRGEPPDIGQQPGDEGRETGWGQLGAVGRHAAIRAPCERHARPAQRDGAGRELAAQQRPQREGHRGVGQARPHPARRVAQRDALQADVERHGAPAPALPGEGRALDHETRRIRPFVRDALDQARQRAD